MNVFGESDSDSGNDDTRKYIQPALKRQRERQRQIKDVSQDEDIYQYDEVYDDIKHSQKKSKSLTSQDASKFLDKLREAKRKREFDKMVQKQYKIDKERELESDELKSKDVFITDSYREHKQELRNQINQLEGTEHTQPVISKLNKYVATSDLSTEEAQWESDSGSGFEKDGKETLQLKIKQLVKTKITEKDLEAYKRRYFERKKSSSLTLK